MKKIVISDIHGQLRMLLDVINAIDCSAIDEFIFLGDYVDRGPESSGVINYLINFSKDHNCVFLKGRQRTKARPLYGKEHAIEGTISGSQGPSASDSS